MSKDLILLIDKPLGWTSFQVVQWVKKHLKVKKAGHAGTLDPLATGLLIVATEKKTKTLSTYQDLPKTYIAQLRLGFTTPSYDAEFPPQPYGDPSKVDEQQIKAVLKSFEGWIEQVPPMFSAVKVQGKRAYALAREGKKVVLKPKKVFIERIEILSWEPPERLAIKVICGKGTYIRSLAHDIGQRLSCGAYLTALRRTAIGPYHVKDAYSIEQLKHLQR